MENPGYLDIFAIVDVVEEHHIGSAYGAVVAIAVSPSCFFSVSF